MQAGKGFAVICKREWDLRGYESLNGSCSYMQAGKEFVVIYASRKEICSDLDRGGHNHLASEASDGRMMHCNLLAEMSAMLTLLNTSHRDTHIRVRLQPNSSLPPFRQ